MKCLTDQAMTACLAGELTPGEQERLEAHIESCVKCRSALESFSKDMKALVLLPALDPSPDFEREVWSRLYQDLAHLTRLGRLLAPATVSPSPRRRVRQKSGRETFSGPASMGRG